MGEGWRWEKRAPACRISRKEEEWRGEEDGRKAMEK